MTSALRLETHPPLTIMPTGNCGVSWENFCQFLKASLICPSPVGRPVLAATMRANQLRLWFSSVAYLMMSALRRLGLKGTDLAKAQCDSIRLKLFKIGARITITTRKIWISLSSSYPLAKLFARVCSNLASGFS